MDVFKSKDDVHRMPEIPVPFQLLLRPILRQRDVCEKKAILKLLSNAPCLSGTWTFDAGKGKAHGGFPVRKAGPARPGMQVST